MTNFKIAAYLLLGYFWLVDEEEKEGDFVDNKGFLAPVRFQLGAVAKDDQQTIHVNYTHLGVFCQVKLN